MPATFWSNTIWYILLVITSILSIALALYKSNNRKFIMGFSLAILGLTFHAEMALLTIFNAYRYFPKICTDLFLDSVIGNYISQISITSAVALATAYGIPAAGNFIIAGIFYLIEELFLKLGIYQHLWYKSWFTFILVLLLLWLAKKWYYHLLNNPKPFIYYLSLFLGARAAFSLIIVFGYIFSIEVVNLKFVFDEFSRNQAVFLVTYNSMWVIIMMIIHHLNIKWIWKGGFFAALFIMQYILIKTTGIITVKNGWFLIITLLNLSGSYFSVVITDYLLSKGIAINSQTK